MRHPSGYAQIEGSPSFKDMLDHASSIELFHLSVVIDTLLDDPKRIVEVRRHLHIGQVVRFLDVGNPSLEIKTIQGRVVAMTDKYVTLHEIDTCRQWKLPYAAVELPQPDAREAHQSTGKDPHGFVYANEANHHQSQAHAHAHAQSRPQQEPVKPTRDDFRVGDRVSFDDRYLRTHIGTIIRINQKTATIDCGDQQWRVSFGMLRRVVDL